MAERQALTDSPWFWVLAFSSMALTALVAMGPKYGGRQAGMDVKYQARERIAAERAEQNKSAGAERTENQTERRAFATANDPLIPLWPLAAILSVIVIFSLVMLIRGRGRPGSLQDGASI